MSKSVNQQFEDFKAHGKLPSPRGIALQIIQLANKENTNNQQIAHLINNDPALAGSIIKAANLLVHREGRPIATIEDGVTVLGIKSVRQLVLGLSLVADFRSGVCKGFDYQKFWAHSVCRGIAAQEIVAKMQAGVPEEAFLLGLLAQIGRLALATIFAPNYSQVLLQSAAADNLEELERNTFGLDHNQITAMMLSDWGLPEYFQKISIYLDKPESSELSDEDRNWKLLKLLHFSDNLAAVFTSSPSERCRQIPHLLSQANQLGIESNELFEMGDRVAHGLREWCSLINIMAPNLPPFEEIINAASTSPEFMGPDDLPDAQLTSFRLRILLVDDDRSIRLFYKTLLEKVGHSVTIANNGYEALEIVNASQPQLIISDWVMPEMDGIELCKALRKNPEWDKIYVLIITAQESTEKLIEAFEAGANDYLTKPINPKVLGARLRAAQHIIQMQEALEEDRFQLRQFADELAHSNKFLHELALTDTLTGLPNRRYAIERLDQERVMAIRGERPLCCMMIDIDHFKSINDVYGHLFGDIALKMVAETLRNAARKQDVVCRIGGEEFLVICTDTDVQAGFQYAEGLRQNVASQTLPVQGKVLHLTISIGVADNTRTDSVQAMLLQADERLYAAKTAGRNRTVAG
jgi:two-component system, cell cycle response regulator